MRRFNISMIVIILLMMPVFSISSVNAMPAVIDFSTGNAGVGGTITTDSAGDVIGSGILIGNMTVVNAPQNNGSYVVCYFTCPTTPGFLDFEYGPNGNYFQITGAIPSLSSLNFNQALAYGSFSSASYNSQFNVFTGSGRDTKSPYLLADLGLLPNTQFDFFGFSVGYVGSNGQVTAISTDIKNTSVPEPSSLLLIGSGLIGLGYWGRKRFNSV